jgi:hypothetical protein
MWCGRLTDNEEKNSLWRAHYFLVKPTTSSGLDTTDRRLGESETGKKTTVPPSGD